MNTTGILTGVLSSAMILAACTPKSPFETITTTEPTSSASTSKGGTTSKGTDTGTTGSGTLGSSGVTGDPTGDTSTGDTSTGETTDCSFIWCGDGGSIIDDCDVLAQDCPEGEKCMPWADDGGNSWNALKCTPIDPMPQQPGDACIVEGGSVSGVDNCAKASMCWDIDPETNEGICIGFCTGSDEEDLMCPPGFDCAILGGGVLILCIPYCNPLLQDCPGDDLCLGVDDGFICALDASGDMGAYGDPCEFANACDSGLMCLAPEYVKGCQAGGCCSPFCDTSKMPDLCPGDSQECLPWYDEGMAPPGFETLGVCGIPQ